MPTLSEIAQLISAPLPPGTDGSQSITALATLDEAEPGQLTFVGSDKYVADLAIATILKLFAPPPSKPPIGIDPAARIDPSASLGDGAAIGPNVVIGPRTRIGRNIVMHAGAFIGEDVSIGDDCQIFHHVVIRERISIGSRVVIHAASVLGTDGFGYRWDGKQHQKVPQIGTIVIEDDV